MSPGDSHQLRYRVALVPFVLGIIAFTGHAPQASAEPGPARPVKVPVYFELNVGQAERDAVYTLRASDFAGEMRADGVTLQSADGARGVLRFMGGRHTQPVGESLLSGRVHYLVGPESSWRRDIPTFGRVRYRNVYAGVDAVFYGNGSLLEYDLIVAPGADPAVVRVRLEGGGLPRVHADGSLSWSVGDEELQQGRAVVYQESSSGRVPIDARYRIDANGDVRVEVGAYDWRLPLVIDPTLNFSSFVAGFAKDMAVDADGNVFLTGVASAGSVATPGAYQTTRKPSFVTKLDPTGSHVFYATYLGGTGIENATAIAVDAGGSAYVAGYTSSSDFPTTTGAALRTCDPIQFGRCVSHGFVTKLNTTGSALSYSTYLGPLGTDVSLADGYPTDIALDASGRASVVGITASAAFPATSGSLSSCSSDTSQGFLITLNAAGTALAFATCIGGSSYEMARGIAATPAGTRIVTGDTASSDFPLVNSAQPAFGGYLDLFAVGFGPTGALLFSTVYGGDFEEGGFGAAVAEDGSIWIAGVTGSTDIPGDERRIGTLGSFDALVLHLSADGDQFLSVTRLGGKRADCAVAITARAQTGGSISPAIRALRISRLRRTRINGRSEAAAIPISSTARCASPMPRSRT